MLRLIFYILSIGTYYLKLNQNYPRDTDHLCNPESDGKKRVRMNENM